MRETGLCYPDIELFEPLADILQATVLDLMGLEKSPPEEAVKEVTALSAAEKEKIRQGIRLRAAMTMVCSAILLAAEIYSSWYLSRLGIMGGMIGVCTLGMTGFTGTILGSAIYSFFNAKKL